VLVRLGYSFAAYEGFVHLDLRATIAAYLQERTLLHCHADTVQHEPSGLLSHAEGTSYLTGANAILRSGDNPDGKPLLKAERGILKDGSNLNAELALGVSALALKLPLGRKVANVAASADGAHHSIRPAVRDHVAEAVIRIREVDDGFLKSSRRLHVARIGDLT
jgi:hypothetical protein